MNKKELDTIEQVEAASPLLSPNDHYLQTRTLTHEVNRTQDVTRREDFFGDNPEQLEELKKLEDQMQIIMKSFREKSEEERRGNLSREDLHKMEDKEISERYAQLTGSVDY